MATVISDEPVTRTCSSCGGEFPYSRLVKDTRAKLGCTPMCLRCDRKRKLRSENGFDLGLMLVDKAPDHRPAVRLRCELARCRERGLEWSEAWAQAIGHALRSIAKEQERESWLKAFRATSPNWRAAYVNDPFDACAPMWLADDDKY